MNFFKKFGDGGLRKMVLETPKAGIEETFQRALSQIKEMNKPVYDKGLKLLYHGSELQGRTCDFKLY